MATEPLSDALSGCVASSLFSTLACFFACRSSSLARSHCVRVLRLIMSVFVRVCRFSFSAAVPFYDTAHHPVYAFSPLNP